MLVAIDPGHGGHDPGAAAEGVREKDIVLSVALLLQRLLAAHHIGTVMTRPDDRFVSLQQRCTKANAEGADVFVSIHCNASPAGGLEPFGSEVWLYAGSTTGRRLADRIDQEMKQALRGHTSRGLKESGSLYVLRGTKMPAALVELGFVNGLHDRVLMQDPDVQARWAMALAAAVEAFVP